MEWVMVAMVRGEAVVSSETKQLHDQECVTESEHCKAIEFLLFLVENKDRRIKQDMVLMTSHKENGCTGRTYQVLLSAQNQHEFLQ